jgi:hypothetical protein
MPAAVAAGRSLEEMERELCRVVFENCEGNVARAETGLDRPAKKQRL